jgi:hypothetical protein
MGERIDRIAAAGETLKARDARARHRFRLSPAFLLDTARRMEV